MKLFKNFIKEINDLNPDAIYVSAIVKKEYRKYNETFVAVEGNYRSFITKTRPNIESNVSGQIYKRLKKGYPKFIMLNSRSKIFKDISEIFEFSIT